MAGRPLALGGGGIVGIAWETFVLAGLTDVSIFPAIEAGRRQGARLTDFLRASVPP